TAKVAGTEIGVTEPEATFSTCFGAPFMPRHPSVYGNLLKERIAKGGVQCWLLNTGWTGGKYGVGQRMPIKATRALLNAALEGSIARSSTGARPGQTRTSTTAPRRSWSSCSSTTSRSSKLTSTKAYARPPRRLPDFKC